MPTIDTPFIMELHPGEELKLARGGAADEGAAASANAFAKNDFQAWVSSIAFVEEQDGDSAAPAGDAAASGKPSGGHRHGAIRVTLVATLVPQVEAAHNRKRERDGGSSVSSSTPVLTKTVTLASCNFSAAAPAPSEAIPHTERPLAKVESTVVFRAPLAFHSNGTIQSLSVVAEDMATTAGSSGSSGSVKRYQGARRFAVHLRGLQQTLLTEEQVVLLAKR